MVRFVWCRILVTLEDNVATPLSVVQMQQQVCYMT